MSNWFKDFFFFLKILELRANQLSSLNSLTSSPPPRLQHLGLGSNSLGLHDDVSHLTGQHWWSHTHKYGRCLLFKELSHNQVKWEIKFNCWLFNNMYSQTVMWHPVWMCSCWVFFSLFCFCSIYDWTVGMIRQQFSNWNPLTQSGQSEMTVQDVEDLLIWFE